MLVSWLLSAFSADHYARRHVTDQDLKVITVQLCSHLLAAGVMKKLEEDSANPVAIFRVCELNVK
jgi:formin 2